MKLSDVFIDINHQWLNFSDSWCGAKTKWRDAKATQFDKQFMFAWEADMPPFLAALETLEEELQAAERELR